MRGGERADAEELVASWSADLAEKWLQAAGDARSEEEIRMVCARGLDEFAAAAGLDVPSRHEYGLAGGRVDSRYGGVVLEFKAPGGHDRIEPRLAARSTRSLLDQIESRFEPFRREENVEPERLLGVGCDGRNILFVRYRGGRFEEEEPLPVSAVSIARLLRALLSLGARGQSFIPENLVRDFGAGSASAQEGIQELYRAVAGRVSRKTKVLFEQWRMLFGEVCGYDVAATEDGTEARFGRLAAFYGLEGAKPAALLFSVHTYYAIFVKFLAAQIAASFSPLATTALRRCASAASDDALRGEMERLEQGGIWTEMGLANFMEGDLFSWYLADWDGKIAGVVRGMVRVLDEYDPSTLGVEPAESRDLLKHLYQHLFPQAVRHALGEYYTPDWLAEHTLDRLEYDGNPDRRVLDPACGSGTFLVLVLNRIRRWFEHNRERCGYGERELVARILANVVGFDLNPLAVMAARVNYLLALGRLLRSAGPVELPVYLCDSVLTPGEHASLFERSIRLKTALGPLDVPEEVTHDRTILGRYAEQLEAGVHGEFEASDFLARCRADGIPARDTKKHTALFETLARHAAAGRDGIWARIIRNAFAPLFVGKADYVVGNPPWINWESLPPGYRDDMKETWEKYGLFTLGGTAARLGGGKKDQAMLFVYVAADRYLRDGGRLGFVITQTVFKTMGAGDGFRRLAFESAGETIRLCPLVVDDLSGMQVFEGATNRTAVLALERRREAWEYPVRYVNWRGPSRLGQETDLRAAKAATRRVELAAAPVQPGRITSPWLTLPGAVAKSSRRILGESAYRAQAGCTTWLNGVYWVSVLKRLDGGLVLVENLHDVGKIRVEYESAAVEEDLVVPLLRGRDVAEWAARPSLSLLLVQDPSTRTGIAEKEMRRRYPKALAYLKRFEEPLRKRSGFRRYFRADDPFYSIYNVGPDTLCRHKVVWRDMGTTIQAAVLSTRTPVCPEHHVMFVPVSSAEEGHFVCGLLMSSLAKAVIAGYTTTTGQSTHIMGVVRIPRFEGHNPTHAAVAGKSTACHDAAARADHGALRVAEARLDEAAAAVWEVPVRAAMAAREALPEIVGRDVENDGQDGAACDDASAPGGR